MVELECRAQVHQHLSRNSGSFGHLMKHGRHSALFIYNLWKGRRKDKDASSPQSEPEHKLYLEDKYLRTCVTDSDLEHLVNLPPGLSYDEWLATHTISFFEHINLMYGTVSEFCTPTTCTAMTAPCNTQYYWFDEKGKKCKCAASQYIDYVMSYIQRTIADEAVFPTKYGQVFPPDFHAQVKKIQLYLFQVLAHIYHAHFKELVLLGMAGHINILMKHFMLFNQLFALLDEKDVEIMEDLTSQLLATTPNSDVTDSPLQEKLPCADVKNMAALDSECGENKENCRHVHEEYT